jgi:hypothetical protein
MAYSKEDDRNTVYDVLHRAQGYKIYGLEKKAAAVFSWRLDSSVSTRAKEPCVDDGRTSLSAVKEKTQRKIERGSKIEKPLPECLN